MLSEILKILETPKTNTASKTAVFLSFSFIQAEISDRGKILTPDRIVRYRYIQ